MESNLCSRFMVGGSNGSKDDLCEISSTLYRRIRVASVLSCSPGKDENYHLQPGEWNSHDSEVVIETVLGTKEQWNPALVTKSLVPGRFPTGSEGRVFGLVQLTMLAMAKLISRSYV